MKGLDLMKSTVCIFFAVIFVALCFVGCSNIPEEPATTDTMKISYVDPYGETAAPPVNVDNSGETTYPVKYIETVNDVEVVLSSYYVYGNSVATITDVKITDDGFSNSASGYADVRIDGIGSRKDGMKIGYTAYDKDGNIVRNSYLLAKLDGVKKGETCEDRRFDFPREAVKIVFYDYVDKD